MTWNKRALGVGEIFVFMLAAVTFIVIMIFGYQAIQDFMNKGEKVQFYQFKTDLETSVQKIYTEYGAVRTVKFQTPARYTQICLVNMDAPADPRLCQYDQIACDVWSEAEQAPKAVFADGSSETGYDKVEQNVFLQPAGEVNIKVAKIGFNPELGQNFFCFPIHNGIFTLTLTGKGDHTEIYGQFLD